MSVFGGDSWGREAQNRRRKVEDLLTDSLHGSSYKKLPSGKFACLVCPHNPVLDSPLMLSMHCKGSRHVAMEAKLKEKELRTENGKRKRMVLSGSSSGASSSKLVTSRKNVAAAVAKPLTEQAGKAASNVLSLCKSTTPQKNETLNQNYHLSNVEGTGSTASIVDNSSFMIAGDSGTLLKRQQSDFLARRERELKFTEAGWKRDGHGRWYRDENVEFDSDEEDPNVSLAGCQP